MESEVFRVGEKFASFDELVAKIEKYKKKHFVDLYICDSRTIQSAMKRLTKSLKAELKYYELKYSCVYGGRQFNGRGKGQRKTMTMKQGCDFTLNIRCSEDGQFLEVKKFSEQHNHEISKEIFKLLPNQRRLSNEEKEKAKEMISLKANKKLVQHSLLKETGKSVLLKDISNLAGAMKSTVSKNNIDETVRKLTKNYGDLKTTSRFKMISAKQFEEEERRYQV